MEKLTVENIECKNFWEFKKLLKIAYDLGYKFGSKTKWTAIQLWFGLDDLYLPTRKKSNGLSLYSHGFMKYIEKDIIDDYDIISFNEWLLSVYGII